MLLVTDRRAGVRHRRPVPRRRRPSSSRAAGVDARIEIGATARRAARRARGRARGRRRALGLEAHARDAGPSSATFADVVRRAPSSSPTDGVVERAAAGQGAGRGRPDPRRVRDRRRRARLRCCPRLADAADRARLRARPRVRDAPRGARAATASTRSSPSGPNGAKPHARPSDRRIEPGELVVIDFGCIVDGYCSDMTRTVSVGDPGPEARRVWDVVLRAASGPGATRSRAGVECAGGRPRPAATSSPTPAGATRSCTAPATASGSRSTRRPGWPRVPVVPWRPARVVTVEPGVYLPGVGGVRIEDTVVVTPDGADRPHRIPEGTRL